MPDITVIGSVNIDLVARVDRFPLPGETLTANDFAVMEGGKGANQAVAAARMGASVAMVGRVGRDPFGERMVAALQGYGVDTRHVIPDPDHPTGTAMILVNRGGENAIVASPGANGALSVDDIRAAAPLLASSRLALFQLEIPWPVVQHAVRECKRAGTRVILNAAPARRDVASLLQFVDILVVNQTEAEMFTDYDGGTGRQPISAFLAHGVGAVVVTLGAAGAKLVTAQGSQVVSAPRVPVVVDTTGAGDAFCGALAAAWVGGADLLDAVRTANAAGALAVTRAGAMPSMPTRAEVETLLRDRSRTEG